MKFFGEPALFMQAVAAILYLAVSFGANLTDVQVGTVLVAVSAVVGVIIRQNVEPYEKPIV